MDLSSLPEAARANLVKLTPDGGCLKTPVEAAPEGSAAPTARCKAFFKYKARYMDDSPVDKEKPDWQEYSLRLGKKFKIEAWEICLSSMKVGETVRLICAPKYGADPYLEIQSVDMKIEIKAQMAAGSLACADNAAAAFCGSCIGCAGGMEMMKRQGRMVRSGEIMVFWITLLKVEDYDLTLMEYWEMNTDEKFAAAEILKQRGTDFFKAKNFMDAADAYHKAVSYMETLHSTASSWDEDDIMLKADALRIPLHLNLAACKLKTKDAAAVLLSCNKVLEHEKHNLKALFRRGQAYVQKSDYKLAREDFGRAREVAAASGDNEALLKSIDAQVAKVAAKEAKASSKDAALYKRMLG